MIGVASRNENRAASSWSRPRLGPATIVMPDRLIPANSAAICDTPIANASPMPSDEMGRAGRRARNAGGAGRRLDAAPDQQLTHGENEAVDRQEDRGRERLGEDNAQIVFEREPGDARGDRRDHEQDAQPGIRVDDASRAHALHEATDDRVPVLAEVDEQARPRSRRAVRR